MTVLVIAAHPDDEVLGSGATLASHVAAGEEVHAVIMSEGATSRYGNGMAETLRKCGQRAAERLGLASVTFHDLPDQRLDTLPLVTITQQIETIVQRLQPQCIYSHFPGDVNSDHQVVSRAAWVACRPYSLPGLRRFVVFETPSSTEWAWPHGDSSLAPNLFVDVTATLDTKLAAIDCYETEIRDYPHPRSRQALIERAAYWGSQVGRRYVEPFRVLREVSP
jgi:LmbE family N-acetylglucosaminyl deacetylase